MEATRTLKEPVLFSPEKREVCGERFFSSLSLSTRMLLRQCSQGPLTEPWQEDRGCYDYIGKNIFTMRTGRQWHRLSKAAQSPPLKILKT